MACSQFNPHLPNNTRTEQEAWLAKFLNNIADACGDHGCDGNCTDLSSPELTLQCLQCASSAAASCSPTTISVHCQACLDSAVINGDIEAFFQCVEGSKRDSSALSGGVIASIVIGVTAGVVLIGFLIWYFIKRKRDPMFELHDTTHTSNTKTFTKTSMNS